MLGFFGGSPHCMELNKVQFDTRFGASEAPGLKQRVKAEHMCVGCPLRFPRGLELDPNTLLICCQY